MKKNIQIYLEVGGGRTGIFPGFVWRGKLAKRGFILRGKSWQEEGPKVNFILSCDGPKCWEKEGTSKELIYSLEEVGFSELGTGGTKRGLILGGVGCTERERGRDLN